MITSIYYFSGTGNSLYVARELQKLLPGAELIPMVSTLKQNKLITNAEKIGFVFPCHGLTIPSVVKKFLKSSEFKSASYFFAVATRGGTIFRGFPVIDKLLKKQGKVLNATFIINMAGNDPKLKDFTVPTAEILKALELNVRWKLDTVKRIVTHAENYADDTSGVTFSRFGILNFLLEHLISFMVDKFAPKVKNYFYADNKCRGCENCRKVCPAGKIIIRNSRPVWQEHVECYLCYACLNFCPTGAIQIASKFWMKSYTPEKGRYPHPYATVRDMSKQKDPEAGLGRS